MIKAEHLASQLGRSRRSGDGYMCRCPCHDDGKASLWITDTPDGDIYLECKAGCNFIDIRKSLNIDKPRTMHNNGTNHQSIEASYDYQDRAGKLIFQKIRNPNKGFFIRRPNGPDNWINNLEGIDDKPLYNLPTILNAIKNDSPIAILEGEKDCKNFQKFLNIPATCNFDGASKDTQKTKWKPSYSEQLKGARVCLLYDNDEAGIAHRNAIASSLKPFAKTISIVHLPATFNNHPVKDFSDFISAGAVIEDFQSLKIEIIKDDLPEYTKTAIAQFIAKPFPPRQHIIGPFVKQGLNMVYAPPGVGKTYFALSLAFAIATKTTFLNWQCEIKQSVIYFDGELPGYVLQDRLKDLIVQCPTEIDEPVRFEVVTPDEQKKQMPDLSTGIGQEAAMNLIGDNEFIVIDNISTLCRSGKENEAESWIPVQNWLLKLRTMGKSVLLVHHSGKGEILSPRGTSKREDTLDLVISLSHPMGYKGQEGCKFEMKFRKSRHFRTMTDVAEVVASYTSSRGWEMQGLEQSIIDKIRTLQSLKMPQKEIAAQLGVSRSYVARIIRDFSSKESEQQDDDDRPMWP